VQDAGAAGFFRPHQTGAFKLAQMFEERGQRHVMGSVQVRDTGGAVEQAFDHCPAGRVGHCGEN
jgi:hypothetical protein